MPPLTGDLVCHPASPAGAVRTVRASVARLPDGALRFTYRVEGDARRIAWPGKAGARRRDGLWQHTCFEAFLMPQGEAAYYELNFSPSGEWAAYRFAGPRAGRESPDCAPPTIVFHARPDGCDMTATLAVAGHPALSGPLLAGLAAVVESDGAPGYWALSHASGRPDFHDAASFTLRVPPA